MTFHFRPAVREGIKPLIGLYAQSGAGKTLSSLLLARGMAGPNGKVLLIDTESGRGSMYADQVPGGYDVLNLDAPYSPARYMEAVTAGENAGYDIIIIDSASHEWEGLGGVCDMAAAREAEGKPGLHNWKIPKAEHQKFVAKLLQSKTAIIVNMRAKFKTRQVKGSGKTEIIKDDFTSPIQSEDFIFEMTAHAEILQDHTIRLTKEGHPDLKSCFPVSAPISIGTGEAIREWAEGATKGPTAVEIHEEAREAAKQGKDHFTKWWKDNPTKRYHANTIIGELKRLTEGQQIDDSDPFAGMDEEQPITGGVTPMGEHDLSAYKEQIEACESKDALEAIEGMHQARWDATPDSTHKQAIIQALDTKRGELTLHH